MTERSADSRPSATTPAEQDNAPPEDAVRRARLAQVFRILACAAARANGGPRPSQMPSRPSKRARVL